jgi:hypothetical protein
MIFIPIFVRLFIFTCFSKYLLASINNILSFFLPLLNIIIDVANDVQENKFEGKEITASIIFSSTIAFLIFHSLYFFVFHL